MFSVLHVAQKLWLLCYVITTDVELLNLEVFWAIRDFQMKYQVVRHFVWHFFTNSAKYQKSMAELNISHTKIKLYVFSTLKMIFLHFTIRKNHIENFQKSFNVWLFLTDRLALCVQNPSLFSYRIIFSNNFIEWKAEVLDILLWKSDERCSVGLVIWKVDFSGEQ